MQKRQAGAFIASAALVAGLGLGLGGQIAEGQTLIGAEPGQINLGDKGTVKDVNKYIQYTTTIDEETRTITWDITLNKDHTRWSFGFSEYAFLPGGLDNSTIHIERRYTDNDRDWISQKPFTSNGSEAGGTDYYPNPSQWKPYFKESVMDGAALKNGYNQSYINTLNSWVDSGTLGGPLAYNQEGVTTSKFNWVVSAKYKEGVNPYDLPFVFGIQQGSGKWPYYIAYGPFNSDNHNLSDVMEGYYGLDPKVEDVLSQYITPSFTEDQKIPIKDKSKLSVTEKSMVSEGMRDAVERAIDASGRFSADQKAHILDNVLIDVKDNGTVTITYPDYVEGVANSKTVLTPDVYAKDRTQSLPATINEIRSSATSVSGTGEPGATVDLTFPGDVHRTAQVQPDGTWSVTLNENTPLKEGDKVTAVQTENELTPSTPAETTVKPPYADEIDPKLPAEKVSVDEVSTLSDTEKSAVEKAIRDANPSLPEGTEIAVADNGDATITYPDKSTDTLAGTDLVKRREKSYQPTLNPTTSASKTISGTGVPGATVTVTLPDGEKLTAQVNPEGSWTADLPEGTTLKAGDELIASQKEADREQASDPVKATVQKAYAEQFSPTGPDARVEVGDPAHLTENEKAEVAQGVKDANSNLPEGTEFEVNDDGSVSVTYPDGSKDTIDSSETVYKRQKSLSPTINPATSASTAVSGTGVAGSSITVTLPGGFELTTTVADDGNWSVDLPSGTKLAQGDTVSATQMETGRTKASEPVSAGVSASMADSITPQVPANKTTVNNASALTPEEKSIVEQAIRDASPDLPEGAKVEIADNGDATITYPDDSSDTLAGTDLVVERSYSKDPQVNPVKSSDTTVTGKAYPGATVEVTLPNGQSVTTQAGADGTFTAQLPDGTALNKDELIKVVATEPGKTASNPITTPVLGTMKDGINPQVPSNKTYVDQAGALTQDEKNKVADAIRAANADPALPEGTNITIADDGSATLTYSDGSFDTIPADQLVVERPTSAAPVADPFDSDDTTLTGKGVLGSSIVVTLPDGSKVTSPVKEDGTWSVPVPESIQAGDTLTVVQTEPSKKPAEASVEAKATTADTTDPKVPAERTPATDPQNLTDAEKDDVKKAVEDANDFPEGTIVSVGDNGDATITYPDGSKDIIPGKQLIKDRPTSSAPSVNPVDSDDTTVSGTGTPGSTITVTYPDGTTTKTTVDGNGTWSVTLPENLDLKGGDTISVTQTEEGKKPTTTEATVSKTEADSYLDERDGNVNVPTDKLPVQDPEHLTDAEKDTVADAVRNANPDLPEDATISVADDGTATVTFADGSSFSIDGTHLVVGIAPDNGNSNNNGNAGDTDANGNADDSADGQVPDTSDLSVALAGTSLFSGALAALAGIFTRRKHEDR